MIHPICFTHIRVHAHTVCTHIFFRGGEKYGYSTFLLTSLRRIAFWTSGMTGIGLCLLWFPTELSVAARLTGDFPDVRAPGAADFCKDRNALIFGF